MMWKRVKSLWDGLSREGLPGVEDPGPTQAAEAGEGFERPEDPAESPSGEPGGLGLARVEQSMLDGDDLGALVLARELLLSGPLAPSTLDVTARLMDRVGEEQLGQLFARAASEEGAGALLELSGAFLTMSDPGMALAMARGAGRRTVADETVVHGLVAEAYARCGDHEAVLEVLSRYGSTWPDPALYRRFATSCVLLGDLSGWGSVKDALLRDDESQWLLDAGERVAAFDPDPCSPHRAAYFALCGGCVVLDGPPVRGRQVTPGELGCIMAGVMKILEVAECEVDRLAYLSPRGEVLAHWLGESLGLMAIPLSGRIAGQRILIVVADGHDMHQLVSHPGFAVEPLPVFQVLKPLREVGGICADLVGVFGDDASLPLSGLVGERTSERLPPRMLLSSLREAAEESDVASGATGALAEWTLERRQRLALLQPMELRARVRYQGDLPDWRLPEVAPEAGERGEDPGVEDGIQIEQSPAEGLVMEEAEAAPAESMKGEETAPVETHTDEASGTAPEPDEIPGIGEVVAPVAEEAPPQVIDLDAAGASPAGESIKAGEAGEPEPPVMERSSLAEAVPSGPAEDGAAESQGLLPLD